MSEKSEELFKMGAFPSNTIPMDGKKKTPIVEEEPKKKIEKVVNGKVIVKKKGLGSKLKDLFFGEDLKTSVENTVTDILVPAAKDAVSDAITGTVETLLFGRAGGRRYSRRPSAFSDYRPKVNYASPFRDERDRDRERPYRSARASLNDIILESRGEAEHVLDILLEQIERYDKVSVADLYEAVGVIGNYTDNNYGWTELGSARIQRVRDGYMLNLPDPILLD